jgi:hypothetical protein
VTPVAPLKTAGFAARDFVTGYGFLAETADAAALGKVKELAERAGRGARTDGA